MCILSMLMFQKMLPLWVVGLLLVTGVQGYQLSSSLASQPFLMPGGAQYRYPINIFFLNELLKIWNKCRLKRCNLTNVFKTASIPGTSWPSRQLELLQILPKGTLSVIEKVRSEILRAGNVFISGCSTPCISLHISPHSGRVEGNLISTDVTKSK